MSEKQPIIDPKTQHLWAACPRCAGQGYTGDPGWELKCTYCNGLGEVFRGRPHHG